MKLDKKERLLLYNQFKILKKLEPNEADSYERYCNILQGGYKKHYRNFIEDFSEELPKSISDEVYKILEMFRNIHDSINRLSKSEKKELDLFKLQFQGFGDVLDESDHKYYSIFLFEDLGLYHEIKPKSFKVPGPKLNQYRKLIDITGKMESTQYSNQQLRQFSNM